MSASVHIAIVVGEASGDILGAGLIRELRQLYPKAEFSGIGGPRMLAEGFHSYFPQDRLAVMGLVEPLKRLPELLRIRRFLREHFTQNPPAVFIGIDAPDFNLTLEEQLKAVAIPTAHYVSPSVWAWRQKRIKKIARAVDLMLCFLPFEAEFYQRHQVPVEFVGHHLADAIPLQIDKAAARAQLHLSDSARVIALMPGSRASEVEKLGQIFLQTAQLCHQQDPSIEFVIPAASPERYRQLHLLLSQFSDIRVQLINGQSHAAMAAADVVLMASGTTTLEAMLFKRPMVIAYRLAWLSWQILSRLVKTPYVGLPNIIAGRQLVPELLQDQATPEQLAAEVMRYFAEPERVSQLQQTFTEFHQMLKRDASKRAAEALAKLIESRCHA
jgi:lipid-A-disaccharide synthase